MVEQDIVFGHGTIDGYLVFGKVLHDVSHASQVVRAMRDFVFYGEAEHAFFLFDGLVRT